MAGPARNTTVFSHVLFWSHWLLSFFLCEPGVLAVLLVAGRLSPGTPRLDSAYAGERSPTATSFVSLLEDGLLLWVCLSLIHI